ncbi:glycosyltransferase [Microbacterium enclense]|uniref:glycosyltransferase n=1 Tax=Microbacterium enclense TaxID=993073 RepID=UPI0036DD074D
MIGWYVHHHGYGHLSRFLAVQPHLRVPVAAFSSLPRPAGLDGAVPWTQLPPDADVVVQPDGSLCDPREADPTARGHLHWAPHGHPGHRARLAGIAEAAVARDLRVLVADVSAEVAVFARLLGLRTVVVTQPGDRTDAPHALAYDLADRILAPWAHGIVPSAALADRGDRVAWTGGVSRYDGRAASLPLPGRSVLFLGRTLEPEVRATAAAALSARGWTVDAIGHDAASRVDDPWPLLSSRTVVVSAAGQNSVADLAAAGARAVVIAQERPFDEQQRTADALRSAGLARVAPADVSAEELVAHVEGAAGDSPDWSRWQVAGAARRFAEAVEAMLP